MDASEDLAALLGLCRDYYDGRGRFVEVPESTRAAALKAMGYAAPESALRARSRLPWTRLIDPCFVMPAHSQHPAILIHFPLERGGEGRTVIESVETDESGQRISNRIEGAPVAGESMIEGARHVRVELPVRTGRQPGYYALDLTVTTPSGVTRAAARLIVTPGCCPAPPPRAWGITLNLYSVRSASNWGIGDLGDLRRAIEWSRDKLSAGFVGINPLHATFSTMPHDISPYAPVTRMYRSALYIDLPRAAAMLGMEGAVAGYDEEAARLRDAEFIEYEPVARLKHRALHDLHAGFRGSAEFDAYVTREGDALRAYATFMALRERFGGLRWHEWPAPYNDHRSAEVRAFAEAHPREIRFHEFTQWLIESQLGAARDAARPMALGLYGDLAVGSIGGGSDLWANREAFAEGFSVGAPPDNFAPQGQDWGFPPLLPERLRETGYEFLIKTLRANMRGMSAIRIDHALGLFRLFWIPEGSPASEGVYVSYPYEEILGVVALEASRAGCVVIAEDLGNLGSIGSDVREALARYGMLSYRLLYFERDWERGTFLPPDAYPWLALSAVNTHDLPTLIGFVSGRDIQVRDSIGIFGNSAEALDREIDARTRETEALRDALSAFARPEDGTNALLMSAHRFLAATPSALVSASLDDIMGAAEQQNLPGTSELQGYPSWRRKTPLTIEEIAGQDAGAARAIAAIFRGAGR